FLVEHAAAAAHPGAVVVDLCCGSGAVGAALASRVWPIMLYAADIDPVSVQCARFNISEAIGRVSEGDLYKALPQDLLGRIDVLVANTPYVPTSGISLLPREAREHEPLGALDGGADGLDVQRRVATEARHWLTRGGRLLVETSLDQSQRTAAIFTESGLVARVVHSDELDATVVMGTRP
ncbi:MAG: methyltransferase, partial [Firmicutes bacterium]|nr:methyltransferase [Bacillota bacterium]